MKDINNIVKVFLNQVDAWNMNDNAWMVCIGDTGKTLHDLLETELSHKDMKTYVNYINTLDWNKIHPLKIIHVSLLFAQEFAATVRACIPVYWTIDWFQEFTAGEIDTENLTYEDYHQKADHWQFLNHFLNKQKNSAHFDSLQELLAFNLNTWIQRLPVRLYTDYCDSLSAEEKLLTLVSRERELQHIFQHIVTAHDWDALWYGYYKYFIDRHLELDGAEGGHEEVTKELINLDNLTDHQDDMLKKFWYLRYQVYKSLL